MASGGRGPVSPPSFVGDTWSRSAAHRPCSAVVEAGGLRILRQGNAAFEADPPGKIIVIMGVSGAGKTTIGQRLAEDLGCTFLEGDDFHPQANIDKMRQGIPLSDDDREPWLVALRDASLARLSAGETAVVVACSALQKSYREVLRAAGGPRHRRAAARVSFICLEAPVSLLAARLELRSSAGSHFMHASLLPSQLALLQVDEEEEGVFRVNSTQPVNDILDFIRSNIRFV